VGLYELLDQAVFQRVKGNHREHPARTQYTLHMTQGRAQLIQFGIDVNPKRLKGPRGRVLARFTGFDRTSHEFG
jgi:hypothetical protein